jgi:hypothetical protein
MPRTSPPTLTFCASARVLALSLGALSLVATSLLSACSQQSSATPTGDASVSENRPTLDADAPAKNPFEGGYPFDQPASELLAAALNAPGTWQWISVPGALCRDGSGTGFFLRLEEEEEEVEEGDAPRDALMITLAGGGACFDALSCSANPANARGTHAAHWEAALGAGVLSEVELNPFRSWSRVFVPYCTGDLHGGRAADVTVCDGTDCPGPQQFVGHRNMELFLHLLRAQFANVERVALVGGSAGGFGTLFNYEQTSLAFRDTHPTLIDDAGPLVGDAKVLSQCLDNRWRSLWNLDATMPTACVACRGARGLHELPVYLGNTYGDAVFGLISSKQDTTLVLYFGRMLDPTCAPGIVTVESFEAALLAHRTALETTGRWSTLIFNEPGHGSESSLEKSAGGVSVSAWIQAILGGEVDQWGP